MNNVAVIVPTRNEEDVVEKYIEEMKKVLGQDFRKYMVVFVDDSDDGTFEVLKNLAGKHDNIFVIHREKSDNYFHDGNVWVIPVKRPGLAGAVIDGFDMIDADKYVVMDVDLQHPPEYVPEIVKALDSCDFVVGSRYVDGGKIEGWSFYRYFVSKSFNVMASMLLGKKSRGIKDLTSGFFGVRGNIVKKCIESLDPIGWKIMLEVLVKCSPEKVCEIPITFRERAAGESKAGVKVAVDGLRHILKLRRWKG